MSAQDALVIEDLRKTYGNGREALGGVSLRVAEGDFFALLGPNGAGKSTLIGIVCSLVRKTSGRVQVLGADLDTDPQGVKRAIGLVPQEFNFNQFEPVGEILVNQAGYQGVPRAEAWRRAEHWLTRLDLWDRRRAQARELSGGMKRRLMIARAMVHAPRLLILDEPTAGVDIEIRLTMWEFLREINQAGTTIILTTHYLEEAESLCRHIGILQQGRLLIQAPMARLVDRLPREAFILNLREPLAAVPQIPGYSLTAPDDHTLEVQIERDQDLNPLFQALSQQGLAVASLRNKQNRLEQWFIDLVRGQTANPTPEAP